MSRQKLLLFDIDGTLLDTGGAGLRSLKQGFIDAFDLAHRESEFPRLDLAGTTDGSIVDALFALFELEKTGENIENFYSIYHGHLVNGLANRPAGEGRRLPGVKRLLTQLRDETDHVLGLLTGNIARGAFTKVEVFGMPGFFEFGAFGDDHSDRNELGPIGIARAHEKFGIQFAADDVYIIGDTPKDIACARACDAKAVAVATGSVSEANLAALDPCFLFTDLEHQREAFLEMLVED
ncbi:MAG: HAD family hydrolase [Verrucomicrobiales bacterium]